MKLIKAKQYYHNNKLVDCTLLDIGLSDNLKDSATLLLNFYTLTNNFIKQVYSYVIKLDGYDYIEYNTTTPNGNQFILDYLFTKENIEVLNDYIKPQ